MMKLNRDRDRDSTKTKTNKNVGVSTAVMAGNDTFQQKNITQNRKTFITLPKHMIF